MLGFDKDETRKHEGIVLNTTHQSASLATADTFVALSDKWIFEVCCHASSQDSSLCPSDVSRLKTLRLFLALITFDLIVFIELKIVQCPT